MLQKPFVITSEHHLRGTAFIKGHFASLCSIVPRQHATQQPLANNVKYEDVTPRLKGGLHEAGIDMLG
jgi:hypothetical protein